MNPFGTAKPPPAKRAKAPVRPRVDPPPHIRSHAVADNSDGQGRDRVVLPPRLDFERVGLGRNARGAFRPFPPRHPSPVDHHHRGDDLVAAAPADLPPRDLLRPTIMLGGEALVHWICAGCPKDDLSVAAALAPVGRFVDFLRLPSAFVHNLIDQRLLAKLICTSASPVAAMHNATEIVPIDLFAMKCDTLAYRMATWAWLSLCNADHFDQMSGHRGKGCFYPCCMRFHVGETPWRLHFLHGRMSLFNNTTDASIDAVAAAALVAAEVGHLHCLQRIAASCGDEVLHAAHSVSRDTVAHVAAKSGNVALMAYFADHGLDVTSVKNAFSETPLTCAVRAGHRDLVQQLVLIFGADVDERSGYRGESLLHIAAEHGHLDLLDPDFGLVTLCDIDAHDSHGETPLMRAVENKHEACVTRLLQCGADVNAKSVAGMTAVMIASALGFEGVLALLLDAKPDLEAKRENDGRTASDMAYAGSNSHRCFEMLRAARAPNPAHRDPFMGMRGARPWGWNERFNVRRRRRGDSDDDSDDDDHDGAWLRNDRAAA